MLFLSSSYYARSIDNQQFRIENTNVTPSTYARTIGVLFDSTMSMKQHISFVCKSAHYHLRNIGLIRKFITRDSCEKIVHAFVSSKLDYCNSLLFNVPANQLHRLQRLQHIAARIITLTRSSEHITPILKSLHWLPVKQRIQNYSSNFSLFT